MLYKEVRSLHQRGPVDPLPDQPLETPILVGEKGALAFDANESSYGNDYCILWPAWVKGERAWLLSKYWQPAFGYCASGTEETILTFEEGVRLLIEYGVFNFPIIEAEKEN